MGIEIINKLKKQQKLTSEELSEKSGVPIGTLNKILNGTTKDPKFETLKSLAKTLGCRLDDFDDIIQEQKDEQYSFQINEIIELMKPLSLEQQIEVKAVVKNYIQINFTVKSDTLNNA